MLLINKLEYYLGLKDKTTLKNVFELDFVINKFKMVIVPQLHFFALEIIYKVNLIKLQLN